MELLKKLAGSRKFLAMLSGIIGVIILKVFKVDVDPVTVGAIVALVASFIVAQGQADRGKEAAKVAALASPLLPMTNTVRVDAIKSV